MVSYRKRTWEELDELFQACLDMPAQKVAAYLSNIDDLSPDDRSHVNRLLAGAQSDFLETEAALARDVLLKSWQTSQTDLPNLSVGDLIGPWRIEKELGRGGSACVYAAIRADNAFNMDVAIKVGRPKRAPQTGEARILARLTHANIARIIDAGMIGDDWAYLAMERVGGLDLKNWIAEEADSPAAYYRVFDQILAALAHAHSRLVIHGDLTPSNIIVTDEGQVKVLDFGIARILGLDTTPGGYTPRYGSPEHLAFEPLRLQSDIWQVGQLARMLWPQKDIPADLKAIWDKACAQDPEQRYISAALMAQDLDNARTYRPTLARPAGVRRRLALGAKRHPFRAVLGGAFVIATAGWALSALWFTSHLATQRDLARAEAQRAMQIKTALLDVFRRADPLELDTALAPDADPWLYLSTAAQEIAEGLNDQPDVKRAVLKLASDLQERRGDYEAQSQNLRIILTDLRRAGDTDGPVYAEIEMALIFSEIMQGVESGQGQRILQRVAAWQSKENVGDYRRALLTAAQALEKLWEFEDAERVYETALSLYPPEDVATRIEILIGRGQVSENLGDFSAALIDLETADDLTVEIYGPVHKRRVSVLSALAGVKQMNGDLSAGVFDLERAIEIERGYSFETAPLMLQLKNNLALAYVLNNEFEAGIELHQEVIAAQLRAGDLRSAADSFQNLTAALQGAQRWSEAEAAALEAARLYREVTPEGHILRAYPYFALSMIHYKTQRWQGAYEHQETARALLGASVADDHWLYGWLDGQKGLSLYQMGETKAAISWLERGQTKMQTAPETEADKKAQIDAALEDLRQN